MKKNSEENALGRETMQLIQGMIADQSLILDIIPIQVWVMSDIETYGHVNQAHANFMGMKKDDLEFRKLSDFLSNDVIGICKISNYKVFETKTTVHTEVFVSNSKGEQRLLSITKTPKLDKAGQNVECIICCAIDITEQRGAETQLKQSEENFRTFIETIDDIVLIGNMNGEIIYANPVTSVKLGYCLDEMKNMKILDLHPVWAQKEATTILTEMFNGKRDICPLPVISKTRKIIPVETRVWLGKWNGENCIFGLSKDLSKQQEALQKFDRLFRMNPALMAVNALPDGKFTDINDAFLNTLGYSTDEVIGKTSEELNLFVDVDEQRRASQMLLDQGSIREIELKVNAKSGEVHDGLFSGDVIESQGKKYFLTVMIDITDRKKAEAGREKTIQELQVALEQIKTLRGIVPICSHCKKIRDDKGYWEKVEAYLSKHTEAKFSHGICPECAKENFPDYSND